MSTRANIIIKDEFQELWFYRHSDGYPEGTLPTLNKFLNLVKSGVIRNNVEQAAGWLIIIGAQEYASGEMGHPAKDAPFHTVGPDATGGMMGWKVGAYEPSVGQHGDIEFLYTVDLVEKTVTYTTKF